MQIVTSPISVGDLSRMAEHAFGDLVKAVVDINRGVLAIDAGMHSDLEALLLDAGSGQADLWGINLYPGDFGTDAFVEFDSMINLRPAQGNRSRSVEDPDTQAAILSILHRWVTA